MPRGDGTGPEGLGPQTGRAAGYCAGFDAPGYANDFPVRGGGRGFGCGRGRRRGFGRGRGYRARGFNNAQPVANNQQVQENEADYLKREKSALEDELDAVKNRLEELEEKSE